MNQRFSILFFLIVYFFCCNVDLTAQLKADFEADTLTFCPPYAVNFKDKSTGGIITSRNWSFGQGGVSNSNNPFPSATYSNSGVYTVTLTIGDGTSTATVSKSAYIKAFKIPEVKFSTSQSRKGCAPLTINLLNQTILGDAPITSYNWNLGNGTRSNIRNPQVTYNLPGVYTVTLSVEDTNQCSNSLQKVAYIEAVPGAKANFSTTGPPSSCQGPHTVGFVNRSSGLAPLQHFWDFGNGNTSTSSNPTETFTSGAYDITYVVTDASGCTDTMKIKRYVTVGATKADFSTTSDTFCLSDANKIQFTNLSVGATNFLWRFGDGNFSNLRNPAYSYSATGTYSVTLEVNAGPNCKDTVEKKITIIQPTASFSSNVNYWCNDTGIVLTPKTNFPNEASSIIWGIMHSKVPVSRSFGKYTIAKTDVGQHVDTMTVLFPKWGTCSVRVAVPTIRIWKPSGTVLLNPREGCVPLIVAGIDRLSPADSLLPGNWIFSSGKTAVGKSVLDTIKVSGKHSVTYSVKHKRGCNYKFGPIEFKAGDTPHVDFKVDTTSFCAGEEVMFRNKSTDSTKITDYHWDLDYSNGLIDSTRHPIKTYTDTGYKSVMLIAGHHGCTDTLIKRNLFRIRGPVGNMNVLLDCDKPYERQFSPVNWIKVQRFEYDFGDAFGFETINQTTNYTYFGRGDFTAKLTLYNDTNDCEYEVTRDIYIRDIKLRTTIDSQRVCFPYQFKFSDNNSQDVEFTETRMNGKSYWQIPFSDFSILSEYKGAQSPMVIGFDINGCPDTNRHWLKTYKPKAIIGSSGDTGCGPLTVQFRDSSSYDTTQVGQYWNIPPFFTSQQTNPTYKFRTPGSFYVELHVTDTLGCTHDTSGYVLVRLPWPVISVDTQVCVGENVAFSNITGRPNETHFWDFGDSLTGTGQNPITRYSKPGRKSIQLRSVDQFGCDSVVNLSLLIDVQKISKPTVIAKPADTSCYPAEIDFEDLFIDSIVQYRYWRFDSSESFYRLTGPNSFYNYNFPGEYGADLIIESTYGCKDTFRFDSLVHVGGPYAKFEIMDTVCLNVGVGIEFRDALGVYEYRMDFGDGTIDTVPGNVDSVFHAYANQGLFPVNLIFIDSLEKCIKSWSDSISVIEVAADFQLGDSTGCSPFNLNSLAKTTYANRYYWYLQDSLITKGQQIDTTISVAGQFELKLIPLNFLHQCTDSLKANFVVHPKPTVKAEGGGVFCSSDSALLLARGAEFYKWTPITYLKGDTLDSMWVKPKENIVYTIIGTTKFECADTTNLDIKVVESPEKVGIEDTTLFVGQRYQVNIAEYPQLNYVWDPPLFLSCFDCANPEIDPDRNVTYTLSISDKYGCFSMDTSFTIYIEDDYSILLPNAFSPNGDDLNETFKLYTKGIKELMFFGIFNRWGELVYSFSDLDDDWDGTFRGNLWPTNSKLVYKGQFKRYNGEVIELTGFIVLVR